jgi:site-specific DNA recombinase
LFVDRTRPDLEEKTIEAAALRQRLKSQALLHAEGEIDDDQLRIGSARIKQKLAAIAQVTEDANRSRLFKGVTGENAKLFPGLHLDRRRAIVDALMTITLERRSLRLAFDPESSMVVDWKEPGS